MKRTLIRLGLLMLLVLGLSTAALALDPIDPPTVPAAEGYYQSHSSKWQYFNTGTEDAPDWRYVPLQGSDTKATYNDQGQLIREDVTPLEENVSSTAYAMLYTYDDQGRILKKESEDGREAWNYTYREDGTYVFDHFWQSSEDAEPIITYRSWDPNCPENWFRYGQYTYTTDDTGRLTGGTNSSGATVAFTYDDQGRILTDIYRSGSSVETTTWEYDEDGSCTRKISYGTTCDEYRYDKDGRLREAIEWDTSGDEPVEVFSYYYHYDQNGNNYLITDNDPNSDRMPKQWRFGYTKIPSGDGLPEVAEGLTLKDTGIAADGVFNTEGYGSVDAQGPDQKTGYLSRQFALVDREGNLVMPYTPSDFDAYYVSGTGQITARPDYIFYNMDGTRAFETDYLKDYEIDHSKWEGAEISRSCFVAGGTQLHDGVAVIVAGLNESYTFPGQGGNSTYMEAYIVDSTGKILVKLPEAFAKPAINGDFPTFQKHCGVPGEGLIAVSDYYWEGRNVVNGPLTYMNYQGETVLTLPDCTTGWRFSEGLAAVQNRDGLIGFIDKTGATVIPFEYTGLGDFGFSDGLVAVEKDGKWGYIDKTGATVIPFEYDGAYGYYGGMASVGKDGKFGLVSRDNKVLASLVFDDISAPYENVAFAVLDGELYTITGEITTLTAVPAAAATCTEPGNIAYWTDGEKYFSDEAGQTEIEKDSWIIPATGHDWGEWTVTKEATETEEGQRQRVCKHDPTHVETEVIPKLEPKPVNPFVDVAETAFYYKPVLWAVENKVTSGTSETTFSPGEGCTRAQVVSFLWRAQGKPEPKTTECPFTDVPEKAYYYKAVLWAVEKKITAGTSETTFSPGETCTRAQIVAFLYRSKGKPEHADVENPFTDVPATAYYTDAVLWAVENKVTSGLSATTFGPNNTCTRGQVVSFLYRAQ